MTSSNMFSPEAISGILTALWVITGGVAFQLRSSGRAQRKALRRLRDKDIMWAAHTHALNLLLASNGINVPDIPIKLLTDEDAEPL